MTNISVTINENEKQKIIKRLNAYIIKQNEGSVAYAFRYSAHTITIYKTNVLVIQGKNADDIYQKIFGYNYTSSDFNKIDIFNDNKEVNQFYVSTIGSDEVGVGDFFGGLCVCAAYVNKNDVKWLKSIGVKDSKKLSDEKMFELFEQIKSKVTFVAYNIDAKEYNRLFNQLQNAHIIKAVLHNKCLWDLSKKVDRPYFVIVDEFVNKSKYAEYLKSVNTTMFSVDIFKTHAEDKYIAVACASIIARVLFLQNHKQICDAYQMDIPLGVSNNVKRVAKHIIINYGLQSLEVICKNHFKTFEEVKMG